MDGGFCSPDALSVSRPTVSKHWRRVQSLIPVYPIQSNSSLHHYKCMVLCRHQSAERPILCWISSLIYPKIQRRQVIMNVLHPSCVRPPGWSLPVLWRRFEVALASICFSSIHARCPKKVRRWDLMMHESGCWLVMRWCWHFSQSRAFCRLKGSEGNCRPGRPGGK